MLSHMSTCSEELDMTIDVTIHRYLQTGRIIKGHLKKSHIMGNHSQLLNSSSNNKWQKRKKLVENWKVATKMVLICFDVLDWKLQCPQHRGGLLLYIHSSDGGSTEMPSGVQVWTLQLMLMQEFTHCKNSKEQ